MSAIISDTDFQSDIKSFKETAQRIQLKSSSINGISVNGTGLPIDGIEFAERSANLSFVRDLEEQERDRRIAEDSDYQKGEFIKKLSLRKLSAALEEAERQRRIADADNSEEWRELLARKVTASISSGILSQRSSLRSGAAGVLASAKQAGRGIFEQASGYAHRAANFFGQKVTGGVNAINENLHDISEKAIERAHEFGGKASVLSDRAFDTVQDLTGKAVLQAQNLKVQAQDQAHKTASAVQEAGEKAIHFGTQTYGDAIRLIAIGKLDFAEETERQYRTTIGLSVERFILALKTSALVRDHWAAKGQSGAEFNTWYGTGILEEFERKRRMIHDKSNDDTKTNARKAAQLIHLRSIETQGYKPQVQQLEKVSAVIEKKAEEIRTAPVRAVAAM